MILLKANVELKSVFLKIIKTMGENVNWTEIFIINNNDLILAGKGRSLFFNFDNKRAYSNIIDVTINEDVVEQITKNELLENTLNMTLYTFGKWGEIKGLKVEKDYDQLNKLLNYILEELKVEAVLTTDNLRFYKEGVQITYEDIIQSILDKSKLEAESEEAKEDNEKKEEENSESELGLWHNMVWTGKTFSFVKEELSESDKVKSRLGKDFYMVNYKCPVCGEKLYMVVYPIGDEFRIDTDEQGVYLARAYTCNSCNSYYTPKPYKMLAEGEVYHLAFEDDKVAYEDYLELLGRQGQRTSNCNFNQYESEYNKKKQAPQSELEEVCSDIDSLSNEEIEELKDKMDSGFYPEESIEKFLEIVNQELLSRKKQNKGIEKEKDTKPLFTSKEEAEQKQKVAGEKAKNENNGKKKFTIIKNTKQDKNILKSEKIQDDTKHDREKHQGTKHQGTKHQETKSRQSETESDSVVFEGSKEILTALSNGDQEGFVEALEKLSRKNLGNLKILIQSEQGLDEKQKKDSINLVDRYLYKEKEKELLEKAVSCKGKNYAKIVSVIDEIKKEEVTDSVKTSILNSLLELLNKTGKKELEHIIAQIPENVSKMQYKQFKEKIEEYTEVDQKLAKKYLDEKRDEVEKREITAFIKQSNPRNRQAHLDLYQRLKQQDFEERNVTPFLEKLNDKVYAIDEAAIRKICPEPADMTFDEGLQAYEEIALGEFLPDLKSNMLETIDQRLTKLKMDECEQLVNKLSKEMGQSIEENSRIYFYNVRKMMRGNLNDAESIIIQNALNSYAGGREKYEFPVLICDASYAANGERGFVLTPNHIFYNSLFHSGALDVMDIESVFAGAGLLNKGIYVNKEKAEKVKVSNSLKLKDLKPISKVLNDFVSYLKEKPESRNVSYLAKEVHKVKCCYRCGYVYKEGSVCPKCGSKFNE